MFIHIGTRKVFVSPGTFNPTEDWVKQQGRNVLMWLEDNGLEATHLIRDRDGKFPKGFDHLLKPSGVKVIKSPPRSPNFNAYCESWIGALKRECLNTFTCFHLKHLDFIVQTYARFHNEHRPHQSKGNQTLTFHGEPPPLKLTPIDQPIGTIKCRRSLGGALRHYSRAA